MPKTHPTYHETLHETSPDATNSNQCPTKHSFHGPDFPNEPPKERNRDTCTADTPLEK